MDREIRQLTISYHLYLKDLEESETRGEVHACKEIKSFLTKCTNQSVILKELHERLIDEDYEPSIITTTLYFILKPRINIGKLKTKEDKNSYKDIVSVFERS